MGAEIADFFAAWAESGYRHGEVEPEIVCFPAGSNEAAVVSHHADFPGHGCGFGSEQVESDFEMSGFGVELFSEFGEDIWNR